MMDLPTPGTSTCVAKARAAIEPTDSDKVEVITISDDDDDVEDDVERLPVQRQQLSYNIKGTYDQCQQLFSASCQVKLTRCQIPANFVAASTKPTVKEEDSSGDDDEEEDDANLAAVSKVTVKEDDNSDDDDHANSSSSRGNKETCQTADAASSTNFIVPKVDKISTGSSSDEEAEEVLAVEKQRRKNKRGRKAAYCRICDKSLSAKWYLKVHIRKVHNPKIHNGKKKNLGKGKVYKCEDCERSYNSLSSFNFHKRENPNGVCKIKDRAKCSRQEKIEKMAKKLLEEEWRPSGGWTCKICQKRMKTSNSYVDPMRSHAEDRRFKCDQCGKSFVLATTLTKHLKLHTGIPEFGCVFCGKGFYQEQNMFRHLRIHTEEKPFFCVVTGCGASFRDSGSLKMHRRRIHLKRC